MVQGRTAYAPLDGQMDTVVMLAGLLMQTEIAVRRCYAADGMLVDEYVPLDFHENREIVEGFDVPLHFLTGHELDNYLDPLLARLVQILVLDIEWRFRHNPLL
jgi:hypothetical protein